MKSSSFTRQGFTFPNVALSKKSWIILALLLWLYFVISHIPAVWGAYLMTRSGDLGMSGVSGTIWSGRASLASVKIKQVDYSLGQLTWKLNVFSLLLLKPCARIVTEMDHQQFDGDMCVGFKGSIAVSDAKANFPTALIQPLLPLPIDGQVSLNIEQLSFKQNKLIDAKAKLTWTAGKVYNGSNWMSVGGFGADVVDDDKFGLSARIVDVNSPVHVDVVLALLSPSGGSVKGSLSMTEAFNREANASAWLSMFAIQGPPDAQGNLVYAVDLNL